MEFRSYYFGYRHQHEDKLHFVLYAYGRVHVTDPGNYPYDSSQWRRYHISAYAHNTILVDGMPQNRRGFNRRLDEAEHSYESPFHLEAEAVDVDEDSKSVSTKNPDDSNLTIIPAILEGLDVEIISGRTEPYVQGWVRKGNYGVRAIPTPTYKLKKNGVAYLAYVFYPTPKGEKCPVKSVVIRNADAKLEIWATEKVEIDVISQSGEKHTWRTDQKENALVISN